MPDYRLDHIAFLVSDLEAARAELPELAAEAAQSFPSEGTREQYLGGGGVAKVLLMQPIGPGPYQSAMERRGPGLHHVALLVDDLDAFLEAAVVGSGWLLHPRSFALRRDTGAVWLTRPGVEVLVEVSEGSPGEDGSACVDAVEIAGLDTRSGLAQIFEACGVAVLDGPQGAVVLGDGRRWPAG